MTGIFHTTRRDPKLLSMVNDKSWHKVQIFPRVCSLLVRVTLRPITSGLPRSLFFFFLHAPHVQLLGAIWTDG